LKGQVEAARALVELGADVRAKTVGGATALQDAAGAGRVEALRALVEFGTTSAAHIHSVPPRASRWVSVRHHQGTVCELPISDDERVVDLQRCLRHCPHFGGDWFLMCEGKVLANDMELSKLNAEVDVVQCMRGLGGGKVRAPPILAPGACLCLPLHARRRARTVQL
jgi:hypothetical protein